MGNIRVFTSLFVFLFIAVIQAAVTTHKPNNHPKPTTHKPTTTHLPTTKETGEYEAYYFGYHAYSHELFTKVDERKNGVIERKCYIYKLSDQERQVVHSPLGLRTLELKTFATLRNAVEVKGTTLQQYEINQCGRPNNCQYFRIGSV